ncbi:MAG: TIGR00730 family Rossman fold protein [Acidobacteriota bacterium]
MRICVYCGSSGGARPEYRAAAAAVGTALARRGVGLVYGGSNVGLMGVAADAAMAAGGEVTGVIVESLVAREVAHLGLPDLRVVSTMHERKAMMSALSNAFLALPGGYGTLDEFFEAVTWTQLGIHRKACGVLNVCGYFDGLLGMLDHAVAEGFVKPVNRGLVLCDDDPERMIERLLRVA